MSVANASRGMIAEIIMTPRRILRRLIQKERRKQLIEPPEFERAKEQGETRRDAILRELRRNELPSQFSPDQPLRYLPYEFIENPPDRNPVSNPRFFESEAEAIGQIVRLYWQLNATELLLGERIVDLLVQFWRYTEQSRDRELPLVRLEYDPMVAWTGRFPWIAVIEAEHPEEYADDLLHQSRWIGIGVDLAPKRYRLLYGRCKVGHGLQGVVGGVVTNHTDSYAVTCAHVLSEQCKAVVFRTKLGAESSEPDVALIDAPTSCFRTLSTSEECMPSTAESIRTLARTRSEVESRNLELRRRKGFVDARILEVPIGNTYFRFPHVQVKPIWERSLLLSIFRQFFRKPFSVAGHSGSWVFESSQGEWIGMIAGGDEDFATSLIIEAEPLLTFLRAQLVIFGKTTRPSEMQPATYQ